jgi:DNA-directed RNA polymerase subunit RPC12/RpoP
MPEAIAQKKYSCPACGGEAQWNPAKQALVCVYCGTVSPAKLDEDTGGIEEHNLVAALRDIPDEGRGWQAEKVSVKCQSCQAISVFDAGRVGQRCEFCGSGALVPFEQTKAPIKPESLLAFKVAESAVRDKIHDWYRSRWFAPNLLKSDAHTDTVKGFYLPYWTFDAQVHGDWTAESGYYYYEEESYRDSNGREQTRRVQKTRWEPSSGMMDNFFDDELVPASKGVPPELLRKIEPFPTHELVKYDPGFLSGWIVEQYQIDLVTAAQLARDRMEKEMRALCGKQVPGDTYRGLRVACDFSAQTFKHILVPVWLLTYNYGTRNFQVVINGYTGVIAGKYPLSWIKVTLAVICALILLAILVLWLNTGAAQR